ncbi:MAG: peptidylprolyl isomerase, partial [Pseudomonadota bacterium]
MPLLRRTLSMLLATTALSLAATTGSAQTPASPRIKVETSVGDFTLQLNGRRAPLSTANFVKYVEDGFYEGTIFHRVIAGFMAQGGGFTPDMQQKETRDPVTNESGNGLSNVRGSIAMARTNDPHSGTAQFYINLVDNRALDPNPQRWGYAVFGNVVEGMETLDKIAEIPTGPRGPKPRDVPPYQKIQEKMAQQPRGV